MRRFGAEKDTPEFFGGLERGAKLVRQRDPGHEQLGLIAGQVPANQSSVTGGAGNGPPLDAP